MTNSELETVIDQLRRVFAAEYARGEKAAIDRIVQAAQLEPKRNVHDTPPSRSRRHPKKAGSGRAPAGAVPALINRILTERGSNGATALEIFGAAKTPTEKQCSYSGVRFALSQGQAKGRYRNKLGKWFLRTDSKATQEAA
jgi:hypothetical protein